MRMRMTYLDHNSFEKFTFIISKYNLSQFLPHNLELPYWFFAWPGCWIEWLFIIDLNEPTGSTLTNVDPSAQIHQLNPNWTVAKYAETRLAETYKAVQVSADRYNEHLFNHRYICTYNSKILFLIPR